MKKNDFVVLLFVCIIALAGCSSVKDKLLPTYNNGGYVIKTINSNSDSLNMVTISGTVFDIKTKKPITNFPVVS